MLVRNLLIFFGEIFIHILGPIFSWIIHYFLLLSSLYKCSLYMLFINFLSEKWFANISSHFLCFLFILLNFHIFHEEKIVILMYSVQFSSVAQSCPTLCYPMNRSTPGLPVHHQLPEFTQIHIHRVSDAIQPSHPLSSPSPPAPNPSQHRSLFQWVNSSHHVAKVLEFQSQHQSFQWTPRTGVL